MSILHDLGERTPARPCRALQGERPWCRREQADGVGSGRQPEGKREVVPGGIAEVVRAHLGQGRPCRGL